MAKRRRSGQGSIYRRASDGKWVAVAPVPEGLGQARRRLYLYGDSPAEVEEKLGEALRRLKRGMVPSIGRYAVGRHLYDWLESVRMTVRPSTWMSYEQQVRIHMAPIHAIALSRLQPADVRRLLTWILSEGLSPATAHKVLTTLRMAIKQAINDGLLERNVASLVTGPRVERVEIVPMTLEQARTFLDAAKGDRLETLYTLMLAVGVREGEALGLRWSHVDLEKAEARIAVALRPIPKAFRADKSRGTRLQLVEPKTKAGRRVIPLPAFVVASLREHRIRQLEEQLAAGRRWKGNVLGLIFTTPIGTPLDPRNANKAYMQLLVDAGLPRFRFHDLRHSAATIMLAAGFNMKTISEILGHGTAGMSELYAHVLPSMKQDVAAVVDQVLTHREAR